jgi:hypothetical protein
MTAQRVDVNVFDGLAMSGMLAIDAAGTLSGARMDPIAGSVTGFNALANIRLESLQSSQLAMAAPSSLQTASTIRESHQQSGVEPMHEQLAIKS